MIGVDGGLPWHLGTDLKRFRSLTLDHAIVMGRRTWDSIGRPLPRRTSIVLSRNPDLTVDGAIVVRSLAEAIACATERALPVDVIGGASLYADALTVADTMELTRVHAEPVGDTWFPSVGSDWQLDAAEPFGASDVDDHPFTFETWRRMA